VEIGNNNNDSLCDVVTRQSYCNNSLCAIDVCVSLCSTVKLAVNSECEEAGAIGTDGVGGWSGWSDGVGGWSVNSDGLRYSALLHAVVHDERRFRQRVRLHRVREDLLHLHDDPRL